MKIKHVATLLFVTVFATACSNDPGYQVYKAYVNEHLADLTLIRLNGVARTVPSFAVDYRDLPDFAAIEDVKERKQAFFNYLRPAIEYRNQLNAERQKLLGAVALRQQLGLPFSTADEEFLAMLRERYKVKEDVSTADAIVILQRRLGRIPESLVLAQAALESGWGGSRFARKANNLFGQWCYTKGCGLVPSRRNSGAAHEVQKFDTVYDAITAYYRNLNTHPAYQHVREIREEARAKQQPLQGVELATGLERYSERGEEYIKEVQQVIRFNNLEKPLPADVLPARG